MERTLRTMYSHTRGGAYTGPSLSPPLCCPGVAWLSIPPCHGGDVGSNPMGGAIGLEAHEDVRWTLNPQVAGADPAKPAGSEAHEDGREPFKLKEAGANPVGPIHRKVEGRWSHGWVHVVRILADLDSRLPWGPQYRRRTKCVFADAPNPQERRGVASMRRSSPARSFSGDGDTELISTGLISPRVYSLRRFNSAHRYCSGRGNQKSFALRFNSAHRYFAAAQQSTAVQRTTVQRARDLTCCNIHAATRG